ncbi:MAG: hypothetical protein D6E12_17975 [Desulfovibrio sp.]|nr:MAG: hypothetical protein D6E12_17975 [Desulfovibrio sp.]
MRRAIPLDCGHSLVLSLLLAALVMGTSGFSSPFPLVRSDGAERITPGLGSEQNPCISPDGSALVFTRFANGYNTGPSALVLIDLASGKEQVLVDDGDHDHVNLPGQCFSPDGKHIAYSSDASGRDEIWLLDMAANTTSRLTNHSCGRAYEPAFSSNGSVVVFEYDQDGRDGSIRAVSVDTGEEWDIAPSGYDDRQPNPSPSSDVVLFQSLRNGTWGLWTISLSGEDIQVLWDTPAEETDASWSPDGQTVVFASDDCEALSCIVLLRQGRVQVIPSPHGWYQGAPALAHDGTVYAEAAPGDPEEQGRSAIYRLP